MGMLLLIQIPFYTKEGKLRNLFQIQLRALNYKELGNDILLFYLIKSCLYVDGHKVEPFPCEF